ncbi:MAG: hypothetical protein WC979_01020 [Candidatus Pacearchaeota archaeon]|jgi:hypothetical protein|nr:hypothetical protein [Clostridia bacterium]
MNTQALELYLYMCSPEPIIKWLEENGVKTKEGALFQLKPLVQSNILSVADAQGGCLSGTESCVRHVITHFEKLEKKKCKF